VKWQDAISGKAARRRSLPTSDFLSSAVKPQAELLGKWFLGTFCQNKKYLPPKVKAKKIVQVLSE
jgi:hypothetical protein